MVFTGAMSIGPGGGIPIFGSPVDGTWSFTGAGTGASTESGLGATAIEASGWLHVGIVSVGGHGASCMFSAGGSGVGSVTAGSNTVGFHGLTWRQSAAGTIVANGRTDDGDIVIVMIVVPPAGSAHNCVAGSATTFTIMGQAAFTY